MVEVEALTRALVGLPAVDPVTFGIDDGEIVAIVGPATTASGTWCVQGLPRRPLKPHTP